MNLAWGARVSPEFRDRVVALCARVGIADPSWLMAAMAFETGRTFSPSVRNAASGAAGLIQFMPSTAVGMGTTIEALAAKSAEEQLDDVEKYLHPYAGHLETLADVYMSILWPAAIGQSDAFPLFSQGAAYAQNRGLDVDNDHIVTKREAAHYVVTALAEGLQPENVAPAVPESPPASATSPAATHVPPTQGNRAMDPLSIIAIVGPLLKVLLPQVGTLFGGAKDAQNAKVIGTVLDTVVQAAGTAPAGATATLATAATAVEKMQAEPATLKAVQDAVLTHPDIAPLLVLTEVGGGIVAAREEAQKAVTAESWWRPLVTPAFIISHWLLGIAICVLVDILWVHPTSWSGSDRSQVLIICITIISGVMGFYIGSSVSSAKKDETIAKVALAP